MNTTITKIHPRIGNGINGVISAQVLQEQCEAGNAIGFNFDKKTEEWSQSSNVKSAVAGTIEDCDYWYDPTHEFVWSINYTVTDEILGDMEEIEGDILEKQRIDEGECEN